MSYASVGTLGSNAASGTSTAIALTTGATAEVGHLVVVVSAWDNTDSSDTAAADINRRLVCTDSAGNRYAALACHVNGQAGAQNGTMVAIFACIVATELASGGTITVTNNNSITGRTVSAWEFTTDAPAFAVAQRAVVYTDAADPDSISLSNLPSREYLLIHALGIEGPNTDAYTWDGDYTQFDGNGAGSGASGQSIRGGFRIATLTGDTVDVSSDTADRDYAQALVAIFEHHPLDFPLTSLVDDFNRADQDPISDSGRWVTANGNGLEIIGNTLTQNDAAARYMSARAEVFPGEHEAWMTVNTVAAATAGASFGVCCCLQALGAGTVDGYEFQALYQTSGSRPIRLVKIADDGVAYVFAQWYATLASGDALGIRRYGDVVEAWFKPSAGSWALLLAAEDIDYISGQMGACMIYGGGTYWKGDDFGGGEWVVPNQISITPTRG